MLSRLIHRKALQENYNEKPFEKLFKDLIMPRVHESLVKDLSVIWLSGWGLSTCGLLKAGL